MPNYGEKEQYRIGTAEMMIFFTMVGLLYSHLCFWDMIIALLGLFLCGCLLQKLTSKGPMIWPVMGIIPTLFFHMNDVYEWGTDALIKAGGTFSFRGMWFGGAYGIVTVDPSNIEYVLKTRFNNFPKGNYYKERFRDLLGDGIFNTDDELWKEQRQLATSEMHSSWFIKHSFEAMQYLVHQKLLKLIQQSVMNPGDPIDIQEVLLRFTFDNICTAALGVDPGCLALELPIVPFARAFEEATELTLLRFMVPPFVWKPLKYFGLGYEKRLSEAIKVVHDFADKTVTECRNEITKHGSGKNRSDILSRFIYFTETQEQGKHSRTPFSDKFLRDFCINIILAGRDTSSVALTWFFWLVQNNPSTEKRILNDINEILSKRDEQRPKDVNEVVFTMEELKKMVYLEAAISESMRLYPPVPIEFKEVIESDILPNGTVLIKGARVLICILSMARMESIWGEDCLEFKPERWIHDGQVTTKSQFKYVVFNAGPRMCLGKKFAVMQMKMVAASILLRYEVKVVEGHSVVPKVTTTLYMKNGLPVTFKSRVGFNNL